MEQKSNSIGYETGVLAECLTKMYRSGFKNGIITGIFCCSVISYVNYVRSWKKSKKEGAY